MCPPVRGAISKKTSRGCFYFFYLYFSVGRHNLLLAILCYCNHISACLYPQCIIWRCFIWPCYYKTAKFYITFSTLLLVFVHFFSQREIQAALKWKEIIDAAVGPLLPERLRYCLPCCSQSLCQLMWEDDDVSLIAWAHSPNITDKFPNGMTEHSGKWPLQFPKWWQQIACRPAKSSRSARWDKTTVSE